MNNISTNPEQKLFVLKCGDGYSCFGFDNAYNEALQLTRAIHGRNGLQESVDEASGRVTLSNDGKPVGPTPALWGTLQGYEEYQGALQAYSASPASKKSYFPAGTPSKVASVLEDLRDTDTVVRIIQGDPQTGKSWLDEYDVVGYVRRTVGTMKCPMLVEPLDDGDGYVRSAGAGHIIGAERVLRIIDCDTLRDLYRAPNYKAPRLTMGESSEQTSAAGYPFSVRDEQGQTIASFKDEDGAYEHIAFLRGDKPRRAYRTRAEYRADFDGLDD